jgi:hypothetical protein
MQSQVQIVGTSTQKFTSTDPRNLQDGQISTSLSAQESQSRIMQPSAAPSSTTSLAPLEANLTATPQSCGGVVFMQTALVRVKGERRTVVARIFLDEGSDYSYVKTDLVRQVGSTPVSSVSMRVNLLDEITTSPKVHPVHELTLTGITWSNSITIRAIERDKIIKPLKGHKFEEIVNRFPHLKSLELADRITEEDMPVHILVGLDNIDRIKTRDAPVLDKKSVWGLSGHNTIFGWVIRGWITDPYKNVSEEQTSLFIKNEPIEANSTFIREEKFTDSSGYEMNMPVRVTPAVKSTEVQVDQVRDELNNSLQCFWKLESIGIEDENPGAKMSAGDDLAVQQLEESIQYQDNRYMVSLPWKPDSRSLLQPNREFALRIFVNLLRRFQADPQLGSSYVKAIQGFKEASFCEPASTEPGAWYMPHHPVIRPDKETFKCRPVFNGSFKKGGNVSLNDALLTGPNMNPEIFDILMRFRSFPVALAADVEKAFLTVLIAEEDRKYLRFFWVENDDLECGALCELQMRVLPFGLTSSPFVLSFVLDYHFKKEKDPDLQQLHKEIFVDDLTTGKSDIPEANDFKNRVTQVFKKAGMNLRGWKSNVDMIRDEGQDVQTKILGVSWNMASDLLCIELPQLITRYTKQTLLSFLAKIYDPLGLVSPGILPGKKLIRELWDRGLNWDDAVPSEFVPALQKWITILKAYIQQPIKRFYGIDLLKADSIQLHCFTDASGIAYACCVYIRIQTGDSVQAALVCSRGRLTPSTRMTTPRRELLGILIGSRLVVRVQEVLHLPSSVEVFGWSDSQIALSWVHQDPLTFQPFVSNRVREVQSRPHIRWSHVEGVLNPADLATRIQHPSEQDLLLWSTGPAWLKLHPGQWPSSPVILSPEELTQSQHELKKIQASCAVAPHQSAPAPIIDPTRFSSWSKLVGATAWVFRFLHNVKGSTDKRKGCLTFEEIDHSRQWWIQRIQKESFAVEMLICERGDEVSQSSSLRNLRPYLDQEGILRIRSRTSPVRQGLEAQSYEQHNLIILPGSHPVVKLLIDFHHRKLGHQGTGSTLFDMRQTYWIVKGRNIVKQIIHSCIICKRFNAVSYKLPLISLPLFRVTKGRPFAIAGCDFAGPIFVKGNEKSHICLFTCPVIRAIHLELVRDLSTETFINAFRRFVARRGPVKKLYSDNAKTFKGAIPILKKMNVDSFYIPDRAPNWGGWWERLIKSTKEILRKSLGKSCVSWDEMSTLLTEIEQLLNNRPLTVVTDDVQDLTPISPSDFLLPIAPSDITEECNQRNLTRRFRHRQKLGQKLWNRWQHDYILRLKQWPKGSNKLTPTPRVDDVVLVDPESSKNRAVWPLGRVVNLISGRDGIARAVDVRLQSGKTIRRPASKVYLLEVSHQ